MRALAITSLVDSILASRLCHLAQGVAQGVEYVLNSFCLIYHHSIAQVFQLINEI
jgi:hypothetical protein